MRLKFNLQSLLKFLVLATMAAITITSATAHARGPYLPQDDGLILPGTLLERAFLTQCDGRDPACDPYSEYVLVQTPTTYQHVLVKYNCYEIDDGPYGALKCEQTSATPVGDYKMCIDMGMRPYAPADLVIGSWFCKI